MYNCVSPCLSYFRRLLFFLKNAKNNNIYIHKLVKINWKNLALENHHELHVGKHVICRGSLLLQKPYSKLTIGENSFIGSDTNIVSTENVKIGNDVLISHDCYITDTDGHSLDSCLRSHDIPNRWRGFKDWSFVKSSPILIEDNVWIGPKVIILKGVVISKGSIVCAGSVVTKNVNAYSIVAGVPAKHIGYTK